MNNNLNKKARSGFIWDLSGSFLRQIVSLVISIILARLLEPKEFGLIGMSMVFISISQVFTDVGFTSGLVQQKKTNDIAYSSVFYVNLGISIFLSILIIVSAPFIAEFYEEPKIKNILYYLSIMPPIAALGIVQGAILTKQINFRSLTIRDIVATLIGGALGVIAAFYDFGVYSLIIQQITSILIGTIMLWFATGWRPKFEFSFLEIKKLFSYSGFVFLDTLFRQIFNHIDTIFIAKVFSPSILGFYSRAASLRAQVQTYTTNSLSKVLFPALSQLQDDDIKFNKMFYKIFNILSGLIILIIAPLYFLSNFIIIFLLGEKWEPSVIIFQILILTVLVGPHIRIMGNAVLAKGYSKLRFNMGLAQRFLMLLPLIIGYYFGITEFTVAMVVSSFLNLIVNSIILDYKLKFDFWSQMKSLFLPYIVFCIFFIIRLSEYIEINNFVYSILFIIFHLLFLYLLKHESFFFILSTIKKIKNYKK